MAFRYKSEEYIKEVNNNRYKLIGIGEIFGYTVETIPDAIIFKDKNNNPVFLYETVFKIEDSIEVPEQPEEPETKEPEQPEQKLPEAESTAA